MGGAIISSSEFKFKRFSTRLDIVTAFEVSCSSRLKKIDYPNIQFFEGSYTKTEAITECSNRGGYVMFWKNEAEFNYHHLLRKSRYPYTQEHWRQKEWLGYTKSGSSWISPDGSSDFFLNWASGQPSGGEGCSEAYNVDSKTQMNDLPCGSYYKRSFSCRIPST